MFFFLFIYLRMILFVIDNNKVYLHVYLILNIQNMRTHNLVVDSVTIYLPLDTDFVGNAGFLTHITLDLERDSSASASLNIHRNMTR